jgi:hypothetical protein
MQLLDHLFYLQVKYEPNGGIAFPAFILGAGVVMNTFVKKVFRVIYI